LLIIVGSDVNQSFTQREYKTEFLQIEYILRSLDFWSVWSVFTLLTLILFSLINLLSNM